MKPSALRRLHAGLTVLWLVLAVPGIIANFVGHFSSWQAARAEEASS